MVVPVVHCTTPGAANHSEDCQCPSLESGNAQPVGPYPAALGNGEGDSVWVILRWKPKVSSEEKKNTRKAVTNGSYSSSAWVGLNI